MNHQEQLTSYVAAFVSELVNNEVEDVVISPGSRSTPMAMIFAKHEGIKVHIHVDERAAAFFALGIAKAKKRPVALLCTSGTAAANYFPAIIEALHARIPLIVLTADRPHELRDVGAPQTIDQIQLYGKQVKWFAEMSPPDNEPHMIRYAKVMGARAVSTAKATPAGPVHLNFPFREPLVPDLTKPDLFTHDENKTVAVEIGKYTLSNSEYEQIAARLNEYKKGLIVCGPMDDDQFTEAVISLAKKLRFPIIADPLSQLRSESAEIIDTYDAILKNDKAKKMLQPEVVIRFGAMPVSKPLTLFLNRCDAIEQFVIDEGGGWRDPGLQATEMVNCDPVEFCEGLSVYIKKKESNDYKSMWEKLNETTRTQLSKIEDIKSLCEGKVYSQLARYIREDSSLFIGNSMPIRDVDTFFHSLNKRVTLMANRGANGIDGVVSTALGVGTVKQPLYLVIGDLTFFHDLNGLIASKLYDIDMTVILINNNGGGIFSFLPQAKHEEHFEELFGTPLHIDFKHSIEMYGGRYEKVKDWDHFALLLQGRNDGLRVLEIETNRRENVNEHRNLWENVSQEINKMLEGGV